MKTLRMSIWKKILLLLGAIFLTLFVLEGVVRFVNRGPKWLNPIYVEISQDHPDLNILTDNTQKLSTKFYDEFLYAMNPIETEFINFTDYYSARLTPDSVPVKDADLIIWTFGGSTMENTETTDRLSIANTIAKEFNSTLGPTNVKNFGTGGFISSYELIKFQKLIREVPESELPTIAIFYDGFNDASFAFLYGPGNIQRDLSYKLRSLVERNDSVLWIYSTSNVLTRYSKLWERTGARLVQNILFPLPAPNTDSTNLEGGVRVYTRNVKMIQATCAAFQIDCFFILQPLIVTKKPLTQPEQKALDSLEGHPRFGPEGTRFIRDFYDVVSQQLAQDESFIDAAHILDGRTESDFYDLGHTSVQTSPVIGEKLATLIIQRVAPRANR